METPSQVALSNSEAKKYFDLLDPTATSFTFQTFADGNTDPHLAAVFEGTLALNKRLKGSAKLASIDDAYKQGAGFGSPITRRTAPAERSRISGACALCGVSSTGQRTAERLRHFRLCLQWSSRRPPETSISIG